MIYTNLLNYFRTNVRIDRIFDRVRFSKPSARGKIRRKEYGKIYGTLVQKSDAQSFIIL